MPIHTTGIKALIELSGSGKEITIGSLSFMIGPRINAAGRMDDAKKAVSLFIEKDPEQAKLLAALLQTDNNSRREADAQITEEAIQMLLADPSLLIKEINSGLRCWLAQRCHWYCCQQAA